MNKSSQHFNVALITARDFSISLKTYGENAVHEIRSVVMVPFDLYHDLASRTTMLIAGSSAYHVSLIQITNEGYIPHPPAQQTLTKNQETLLSSKQLIVPRSNYFPDM